MFVPVACGCSQVRKYISTSLEILLMWLFFWHSYRVHASGCTRSTHMLLHGTSVAAGVPRDPWACWGGSRGISAAVPAPGRVSRVGARVGISGQRDGEVGPPAAPGVVPAAQHMQGISQQKRIWRLTGFFFPSF